MIALVLRSAIERARISLPGVVASLCGAFAACVVVALASPLSLAGGARAQQAAAIFAGDLSEYRAASAEVRSAPLVSASWMASSR